MVEAEDRMERALATETQAQGRRMGWASSLLGGNHGEEEAGEHGVVGTVLSVWCLRLGNHMWGLKDGCLRPLQKPCPLFLLHSTCFVQSSPLCSTVRGFPEPTTVTLFPLLGIGRGIAM